MKKVLILGAGQLARMMELAGTPLNLSIQALDVANNNVVRPLAPEDIRSDLTSAIAEADVITAEFEHVAHDVLAECELSGKLLPQSQAIKIGGDRRLEKALLASCEVANAKHYFVESKESFDKALECLSLPIIFKSALEGYDGKGQRRVKKIEEAVDIWLGMSLFLDASITLVQQGIVAEQMVAFEREVSLVGARSTEGEVVTCPFTENHHTN